MTPRLRIEVLRLVNHVRAMTESDAGCYCGRRYRITFGIDFTALLALIEALVEAEPEPGRFTLLEYK